MFFKTGVTKCNNFSEIRKFPLAVLGHHSYLLLTLLIMIISELTLIILYVIRKLLTFQAIINHGLSRCTIDKICIRLLRQKSAVKTGQK